MRTRAELFTDEIQQTKLCHFNKHQLFTIKYSLILPLLHTFSLRILRKDMNCERILKFSLYQSSSVKVGLYCLQKLSTCEGGVRVAQSRDYLLGR